MRVLEAHKTVCYPQYNSGDAPLVIWLQGGPGGSSLFGLFVENGPFVIDEEQNIDLRPTSWSIPYNVLYFDQPAGTGFSFTDKYKETFHLD